MKRSRHHETRWLAVVIVSAVYSGGHWQYTWTNENISSSSLSASAPLSNHYWFVLHSENYHPELKNKNFTSERQKNVRNG